MIPSRNHNKSTPQTQKPSRVGMSVPLPSSPVRNVTYGVNYVLPSVDQFVDHTNTPRGTSTPSSSLISSSRTPQSSSRPPSPDENNRGLANRRRPATSTSEQDDEPVVPLNKRSRRERRKPREKPLTKHRVRYEMNDVPVVRRNLQFVQRHREAAAEEEARRSSTERVGPRRSRRKREEASEPAQAAASVQCDSCNPSGEPFLEDSSVVWIPQKRAEWEDCLAEMTSMCTSAALRRHLQQSETKPFFPPLSQAYIRDRVDIDDPLNGYQIRHKTGGWLQGFVMWTSFTTWTHFFAWDTLHAKSGVDSKGDSRLVDKDGSLSAQLEAQPRSGDPLVGGVVFPTIAEISLLGGLGCGEYLLRMALEDMVQQGYNYVALQATEASKSFYERFGFCQVGAVSRYGFMDPSKPRPYSQKRQPVSHSDIVGYRHWTYANETKSNLEKHGGPSYMMALKLPKKNESSTDNKISCSSCCKEVCRPSVFDALKGVAVEEKPEVSSLGNTSTPMPSKKVWAPPVQKKVPQEATTAAAASTKKSKPKEPTPKKNPHGLKRQLSGYAVARQTDVPLHRAKRQRTSTPRKLEKDYLLTPPPEGQTLTYAQKQYQSVWLAVPPTTTSSTGRKRPKERPYTATRKTPNKNATARN